MISGRSLHPAAAAAADIENPRVAIQTGRRAASPREMNRNHRAALNPQSQASVDLKVMEAANLRRGLGQSKRIIDMQRTDRGFRMNWLDSARGSDATQLIVSNTDTLR